jgi:uncharacterized membrane protein YkvA (DUF1232 family)
MDDGRSHSAGKVLDIIGNFRTAWRLVRDPSIPLWTKGVPLATLAYVLWPMDIVTDLIPGLGQLDDLAVILIGLRLFIALGSRALGDTVEHSGSQDSDEGVIDTTFQVLQDSDEDPKQSE